MTWRDSMGVASFRGVEFEVSEDDREGGRDSAAHHAPHANTVPYVEDTGIKGSTFTIEGFLVGPDCLSARNVLLTALELEGSGELRHPHYGALRVQVDTYKSHYSTRAGGMVTLSMTFIETSAEPSSVLDVLSPEGTVAAAVAPFEDASLAQFLAQYTTVPYSAEMQGQLAGLASAVQQVSAVKALADQDAADLWRQTTELADDVVTLLASPLTLASKIQSVVATLAGGLKRATSGISPLTALLDVYSTDPGPRPDDTTPDGATEAESWDAIQSLTKRVVLGQAADIAVSQTYEAHEDAVGAREQITDLMDEYCEEYQDDSYNSMMGLRRALYQAVPPPDESLPHIEAVSIPSSIPSLVLAYTLHGKLDREESIIRRNGVADPTYLPGGTALEVLSR